MIDSSTFSEPRHDTQEAQPASEELHGLWTTISVAEEVGEGLERREVLQREVSKDSQLRKGNLLSRIVGEFEIFTSAFNLLSAFGAGVEPSARAAHKMLEAQFLFSTFPANGHHHLGLLLGQRTVLKRIHELSSVVGIGSICTLQHQRHVRVSVDGLVHRSCGISTKAFLAATNERIAHTGQNVVRL